MDQTLRSMLPAGQSHPPARGCNERTGHLRTTLLQHAATQDRLSWYAAGVQIPGWGRSLQSTQRLPGMGRAARVIWISQGIRRGDTVESPPLRGRETVLGFHAGKEGMRRLTAEKHSL